MDLVKLLLTIISKRLHTPNNIDRESEANNEELTRKINL